jgi:y4mF family transcriptional regulator
MNISAFIKSQRKLHGLNQIELARKAGVGLRFIRELEQGKPTLRMDKVNQVLRLFGKTLGPVDWRPKIEEIGAHETQNE